MDTCCSFGMQYAIVVGMNGWLCALYVALGGLFSPVQYAVVNFFFMVVQSSSN